MRKSILIGLGLAVSFAGVAAAQKPGADTARRDRAEGRRGGPDESYEGRGGPRGLLLKDITLTDAQKTQLKELRTAQHDKMDANREQNRKQFDELKAARQRGDTAAVKAIVARNRQAMEQARAQDRAAIRNILTAEQRVQFDKNVAELKQREQERAKRFGEGGKRGPRDARFRGGKPGNQG